MDLPTLQALVTRSTLLTETERKYWLGTLPTMSPEQCEKLEHILTEAEKIPLAQSVHTYYENLKKTPIPTQA